MNSAKLKARLFSVAAGLFFAGCATTVDFPMTHFQSPETTGAAKIRMDVAYQAQNSIVLSDDFTLMAPTSTNPRIETDRDIFIGGSYGVIENLDLGIRSPTQIFAKYQFVGASRAQAVENSFSMAFTTSVGHSKQEQDATPIFSTGVYEVNVETTYLDLLLVSGYRVSKTAALYAGPYYTRTLYEGDYKDGATSTLRQLKGSAKTWGGVLGVDFIFDKIGIQAEFAFGNVKTGFSKDTAWGVGALGSLTF